MNHWQEHKKQMEELSKKWETFKKLYPKYNKRYSSEEESIDCMMEWMRFNNLKK